MTAPTFTSVPLAELPQRVRANTISDEDKATATAVSAILTAGQAAKASATFAEKRKATDAGVKLAGVIRRLATIGTTGIYTGKTSVRTLQLGDASFTFAIAPKADAEPEATEAAEEQVETPTEPAK